MKPDMTDDWMNPLDYGRAFGQSVVGEPQKVKRYVVQRAHAPPITTWIGEPPGPDWRVWSEHETEKERDAELKKLHAEHPMWQLRPRNRDYRGRIEEPYGP